MRTALVSSADSAGEFGVKARFDQSAQIPGLLSRLLQSVHPDFAAASLEEIEKGFPKSSPNELEGTLYSVMQGGHVLHPGFITYTSRYLPDSAGNPISQYCVLANIQSPLENLYTRKQQQTDYAAGAAVFALHPKTFGPARQVIEISLVPHPDQVIKDAPRMQVSSANYDILTKFLAEGLDGLTVQEQNRLVECRNTASVMICEINFGQIDETADDLHKILWNLYLADDKDFAWLEEQGILLDEEQKQALSELTHLLVNNSGWMETDNA